MTANASYANIPQLVNVSIRSERLSWVASYLHDDLLLTYIVYIIYVASSMFQYAVRKITCVDRTCERSRLLPYFLSCARSVSCIISVATNYRTTLHLTLIEQITATSKLVLTWGGTRRVVGCMHKILGGVVQQGV